MPSWYELPSPQLANIPQSGPSTLAGKTEPNTGRIQPTETRDSATANRTFLAKIEALNEKLESQKTPAKPVVTLPEISVLAKLDALIDGITDKPEEQQAQSLLSKFEELLEKATKRIGDGPLREGNTATLAAFSEANKTETSELMKKIRHMENTFTDKLENLYRRVDNRINGLARRNQTGREEQIDYREYNQRRAKPVCYRCGRVGHIQYNCYSYYQPEDQYHNQAERHE
ncbi:hypothetical protein OS493_033921 [Desmophyllum pertusum]|uniref:CCHC-type domain-containing protein n=1 Tax=Desmophyllum pertusum TaxID=174260 RepID=A0A9W9ZW97_9CNID|nr:hypothetical protein OS493_033921 [Desmophyllum pertusum]